MRTFFSDRDKKLNMSYALIGVHMIYEFELCRGSFES